VDADRVNLGAKVPANPDDKFFGSQAHDMHFPNGTSMQRKDMATSLTRFVDDLHGVDLILRVDMHFHNLPIFGKDIICKFLAPCAARRPTSFRDHSILVPGQVDSCRQQAPRCAKVQRRRLSPNNAPLPVLWL
jgi:hypothetical protein